MMFTLKGERGEQGVIADYRDHMVKDQTPSPSRSPSSSSSGSPYRPCRGRGWLGKSDLEGMKPARVEGNQIGGAACLGCRQTAQGVDWEVPERLVRQAQAGG